MARKKITPKEYSEVATGIRLSSHEKVCAERMKLLHESITELNNEVKSLRTDLLLYTVLVSASSPIPMYRMKSLTAAAEMS